jgi:hypothetical protein
MANSARRAVLKGPSHDSDSRVIGSLFTSGRFQMPVLVRLASGSEHVC